MLTARAMRAEKILAILPTNSKDFKGKCLQTYFSRILRKCPAEFFKKFSHIFRRKSPEISAAWRAAFSARNRRKVGVGGRLDMGREIRNRPDSNGQ